jgi:hypothetical protein
MFHMSGFHKSSISFSFYGDLQELIGHPLTRLFNDPYHIINAPASANADPFLYEGGLDETCDFITGFGLALKGGSSLL